MGKNADATGAQPSQSTLDWLPPSPADVPAAAHAIQIRRGRKHHARGVELMRDSRWSKALGEFEDALRCAPLHPGFHFWHGVALTRLRRHIEAIDAFRYELRIVPNHAQALAAIGICLASTGRTRDSIAYLVKGLRSDSRMPVAIFTLGLALLTEGRRKEAIKTFSRLFQFEGSFAEVYRLRGLAYAQEGEEELSIADMRAAAALDSKNYQAMLSVGLQIDKAAKERDFQSGYLFEMAAKSAPNIALAQFVYGQFLFNNRRYELGLTHINRAIELEPLQARYHHARGFGLLGQGRIEEAIKNYDYAAELDPTSVELAGDMLFVLQHKVGISKDELLQAHKKWAALLRPNASRDRFSFSNNRAPSRKLRIGLVSADLHRHAVAFLTLRAFQQLAELGHEIYCYKTDRKLKDDDISERYKSFTKSWQDVSDLDDPAFAAQIEDHAIDILFDLSGHTAGNRLSLFAMRAAPIQLSWAGYVGTLGLDTIDGIIADPVEVPPAHDAFYTERVIRLPDCYVCYDPPMQAPDTGPLPFLQTGVFTFGCFNRPAKLNSEVGRAWSKILEAVPNSRILMTYGGMSEQSTRESVYEILESGGVARERVDLVGEHHQAKLLQAYAQKVDLALDPFPYSGGVTTLEAMWMGVPVVTVVGDTFAGRHSATHLTAAGLAEFCTESIEDYINLAVDWTRRPQELASLRAGLRQRVATSPLSDQIRFGHNLDVALTDLWKDWCARSELDRA